ncbi:hypothetical protein VLK31_30470 [Variovorax sp. H27-G14]|uniref:hypothetical protein n=1 Tax=Variovorax sp. H27-G14 TaxID=3111914 RepID=UPI0038FC2D00
MSTAAALKHQALTSVEAACSALTQEEAQEIGRCLGHDLAKHGVRDHSAAWPPSVMEGYAAAKAVAPKRLSDRFVRKWLQLRLNAFTRGRAVDEAVTPEFLTKIDTPFCPVTRQALTHAELLPTDWSIDRLNNDGAYAQSNLVVMSTAANRSKGDLSHAQVMALARGEEVQFGLSPGDWLRLAALMLGPCHAMDPKSAPFVPMVVAAPPYVPMLVMQQVQHVLAQNSRSNAVRNALLKDLRVACKSERAQNLLALLSERVYFGVKGLEFSSDVWLQSGAVSALHAWRESLDDPSWGAVGEITRHWAGGHKVGNAQLEKWKLERFGYF